MSYFFFSSSYRMHHTQCPNWENAMVRKGKSNPSLWPPSTEKHIYYNKWRNVHSISMKKCALELWITSLRDNGKMSSEKWIDITKCLYFILNCSRSLTLKFLCQSQTPCFQISGQKERSGYFCLLKLMKKQRLTLQWDFVHSGYKIADEILAVDYNYFS